jgi:hypothetical protein
MTSSQVKQWNLLAPAGRLGLAGLLVIVGAITAACGGGSEAAATSKRPKSSTVSSVPSPLAAETEPADPPLVISPRAPLTQPVDAGFDPPFSLRIPARWTSVLRDVSAFQVYAGKEEYEITFDHTYRHKESVAHAVRRLTATAGLTAGRVRDVVIGLRRGKGFSAGSDAAVMFGDSGFHTNEASRLEVFAVPAGDGTTITVFLTAGGDPMHGLDALAPLARRIFKTVTWQAR